MGIYTMQMPGFDDPGRQQALQEEEQDHRSALNRGLEGAVGDYLETKNQKKTLAGASDILSKLGKDYELEDILALGKQMNSHPNAIQVALQTAQASQKMKIDERRFAPKPAPMTEAQKLAHKTYNDYMGLGNDALMVRKDLDRMQKQVDKYGDKMGFGGKAWAGENLPGGKYIEPAWAKAFNSDSTNLIGRYKDIFKGRITDTDLRVILKALPSASLSREQNQAILDTQRAIIEKYIFRAGAAQQVRQSAGGVPEDFQGQIFNEMKKYDEEADAAIEKMYSTGAVERPEDEEVGGKQEKKKQNEVIIEKNGKRFAGTPEQAQKYMNDPRNKGAKIISGGSREEEEV